MEHPFSLSTSGINESKKERVEPYMDNGGTILGIGGSNYIVGAADTRMIDGYEIRTRNYSKICVLTDECVLLTSGMQADAMMLQRKLLAELREFAYVHKKQMSGPSIAQRLSNILYSRRFFPYYTFNLLIGFNNSGEGCCWNYDAIGSFEERPYSASGSGSVLVHPLLDHRLEHQHMRGDFPPLTAQQSVSLARDAITSAGERDIHTGDYVEIVLIEKGAKPVIQKFELNLD